jgi:hypothetical protein
VLGKGAIAVLAPLALADMAAHARRVNVTHLQRGAFLKAQTAHIDGGEAETVAGKPHAGEDGTPRRGAEDAWELLCPWGSDEGQRGPCPSQGVRIKKRAATEGDGPGTARVVLNGLEREDILTPRFRSAAVRGLVRVRGQLPNGADIPLLGPFGQAAELQGCDHPLAQWGHGSPSWT